MANYVINKITIEGSKEEFEQIKNTLKPKDPSSDLTIDFNSIIERPKSLDIVSGGHADEYIALYLKTLTEEKKFEIFNQLQQTRTSFYGNYFNKYKDAFTKEVSKKDFEYMKNNYKKDYAAINPSSLEAVGKTYIDNILIYGFDDWYDWSYAKWGTKWGAMSPVVADDYIEFDTANSPSLPITHELSRKFPNITITHEWADEDIGSNCGRCVFKSGTPVLQYSPINSDAVLFACNMWGYDPKDFGVDQEKASLDVVMTKAEEESKSQHILHKSKNKEMTPTLE